jgi:hypothetical protein
MGKEQDQTLVDIQNKDIKVITNFIAVPNASLRGKNTFAKIVEGRKQQTYFCPFE